MTACLHSVLVSYRLGNICLQKKLYCLWTKKSRTNDTAVSFQKHIRAEHTFTDRCAERVAS